MNIALSDTFAYCALYCFLNWFCCTVTFHWGLHLSDVLNTCCLMWKGICCSFCLLILFNHSLRPFQFAHQLCHFCLHMFFSCLRFCFFSSHFAHRLWHVHFRGFHQLKTTRFSSSHSLVRKSDRCKCQVHTYAYRCCAVSIHQHMHSWHKAHPRLARLLSPVLWRKIQLKEHTFIHQWLLY